MNIAVMCDDLHEVALITLALQRTGMLSTAVASGDDLIERWSDYAADGIVLASAQACTEHMLVRLRQVAIVPVVVVCDALAEAQQIALLEHGATLMFTRPYSIRLLALNMRALLQIASSLRLLPTSLEVAGITLDPQQHTVALPGQAPQRLTQMEFKLLYVLMHHHGQVIPSDTLVEKVWGYRSTGDGESLRKLVHRVRARVAPQCIKTVAGVGYSFVVSDG